MLHVGDDVGDTLQQRVDGLAELRQVPALAADIEALRQVALSGSADDLLRLGYRFLHLLAQFYLGGHVARILDDLVRLAMGIQDRVVAALDPDLLAALADALV